MSLSYFGLSSAFFLVITLPLYSITRVPFFISLEAYRPKLSILDETDSGLDIDALKIVSNGVNSLRKKENSFLIITHYQRLLNYIKPDFVHVLKNGKIIKSGGPELALELEKKGYESFS